MREKTYKTLFNLLPLLLLAWLLLHPIKLKYNNTQYNQNYPQNTLQTDILDTTAKSITKTLLYGGSLKNNLIDNATTKLTNKGFKSVGDISMVKGYQEGSLQKSMLHSLTGGVASKLKGGSFVSGV